MYEEYIQLIEKTTGTTGITPDKILNDYVDSLEFIEVMYAFEEKYDIELEFEVSGMKEDLTFQEVFAIVDTKRGNL